MLARGKEKSGPPAARLAVAVAQAQQGPAGLADADAIECPKALTVAQQGGQVVIAVGITSCKIGLAVQFQVPKQAFAAVRQELQLGPAQALPVAALVPDNRPERGSGIVGAQHAFEVIEDET